MTTRDSNNPFAVNSREYWDYRFDHDWDANSGPKQARFFAELAVSQFPAWLVELTRRLGWAICDWGCAEGAGTLVLKNAFPGNDVLGIDFSEPAIRAGRKRYPSVHLEAMDVLSAEPPEVDLVFSSNTLEHFKDPWVVLRRLTRMARHAVVLLLPWEERERFSEHFVTFDENNVPLVLDSGFVLAHRSIYDTSAAVPTYWVGKQVLLVYLRPGEHTRFALTLGSLGFSGEAEGLTQAVSNEAGSPRASGAGELHGQLRALNARALDLRAQLAKAEKRITELNERLHDKECYIASLRNQLQAAQGELDQIKGSSLVVASRKVDKARDRVRGAVNRVAEKVQRDGVIGLGQAVTRRLLKTRPPAPRTVEPAAPRVSRPLPEWPHLSIRLLKPIEVEVQSATYSFPEGRAPFAVVSTVKNEDARLADFLDDLSKQTLQPNRLVIVDGGSTDHTVPRLREFEARNKDWVTVLSGESCNIARGRNLGVAATREQTIIFVDAGCRLSADVFANLYGAFADGRADLVAGIYHATVPTEHARHFIPDWETFDRWDEFLPSARCVAVRRSLFERCGGFPEFLTLTGEDTLFDINYRRVSSRWVVSRTASVTWDAPTDAARAHKLVASYSRGDGESGVGDFIFRPGLEAEFPESVLAHQLRGYREGLANRARIEAERRKVKGVVLVLSGVPFTDIGGGQRATQLALELIRSGYKVIFVNLYPRYGEQVEKVYFDVDLTLLELYSMADFDARLVAERYGPTGLPFTMITEFPHPAFMPVIEEIRAGIPKARYVFDSIDLWDSALGGDWYEPEVEAQLLARSDLVVASARTLQQALEPRAPRPVHLLANAVNGHLFDPSSELPRPADVPASRPYVVYVGSLYGEWFDWESVELAARELPNLDFVFIGDAVGVEKAQQLRQRCGNTLFLGPRPQRAVPAYLKQAAACLIPFRTDSAITRFVNPLKVYEYLAMRRPVAATRMEELLGLPGVSMPEPAGSFAAAIDAALSTPLDEVAISRFIAENTWAQRIKTLEGLLAGGGAA